MRHVYHDVAQLALCEVGDADYGRVALDAAPLVVVRVFQICGFTFMVWLSFKIQMRFFHCKYNCYFRKQGFMLYF